MEKGQGGLASEGCRRRLSPAGVGEGAGGSRLHAENDKSRPRG